MSAGPLRFGVVLPHFGPHASGPALRLAAGLADAGGFDSLWVRDHLVFHPHRVEPQDPRFIDGFVTLSHAAAVTEHVELGTAAAIPLRHPLTLAQLVAGISHLSGRRVLLGLGAGHRKEEFAALGQPSTLRERADEIIPQTIGLVRRAWQGPVSGGEGRFGFDQVELEPKPPVPPAIWYCGTSPKARRIALEHCEGWAPGRITLQTLARIGVFSRPPGFRLAVIPLTVVAASREQALARTPLDVLYEYVNGHRWIATPDGGACEAGHLDGLLLAGPPDDYRDTLARYARLGVTDVIFDLRLMFGEAASAIEAIAEALPMLRASSR